MPERVAIFVTCLVDQFFPRAGMAMAQILDRLGYEVEFREQQTCCGQPAFNSGFHPEARRVADHFLETFADAGHIVVPSGSCAAMISHHFADLYRHDEAKRQLAESVGGRVREFSQFLLEVAGVEDLGAKFPYKVTYHDSCHALREMKIKNGPRRLLRHVQGLELVEMDAAEECCGFGGTFSVKFPELSGGMAQTKIQSILRTGATHVVSVDSSCLMQLEGALRHSDHAVETVHLAEVLAAQ